MSIKIGNNDITDVKLGNTQVNSIYLGSTKVWEKPSGYIDLSQFNIALRKGTPDSSSGIAGRGYGNINRDSINVEFYVDYIANVNTLNKYWKTASQSATTRPDIGLFYTIASTSELNYNNVTTGTYAFKFEDLINGNYHYGQTYNATLIRTAGSSSYPYRALSIGTTSGVYYGDKTSGAATAVNMQYIIAYSSLDNLWDCTIKDVSNNINLLVIFVKLKEA